METYYNKVYDILETVGAALNMRKTFVHAMLKEDEREYCEEWRFMGVFGMSGKYWKRDNKISGDVNDRVVSSINTELSELNKLGE